MTAGDSDPALRRFELDAVIACGVVAVLAFALTSPNGLVPALNAFLAVLAGGLLTGLSYRAIKGGVDVAVVAATGAGLSKARRVVLSVKFFTRYALLAVAAYVMLTCFHLHPVGVLAGATSPFLAAVVLVGRLARARSRGPR